MPKTYKWTIEIEVDATWVADGFDVDSARIETWLMNDLTSATADEVGGRVIKAPGRAAIRKEQGYNDPPK